MNDRSTMAKVGWRHFLPAGVRPYVEPAPFAALFLGISSGFPFAMIGATLTSRLAQDGIEKSSVTAFALTFLAYNLKWAWAPIVDKYRIPLLGVLGQRRSWLILSALLVMAAVSFLGALDPNASLQWVAVAAILVGITGATYDIVIDAYRIELLEPRQLGAGSGMSQYGWRIGSAAAGALALVVAARWDWTLAYLVCTIFALPAVITGLVMGEPKRHVEREWPRFFSRKSYAIFLVALPLAYLTALLIDWLLDVQILTLMVIVGFIFPMFDLSARRARTIGWSPRILWLLVLPVGALLLVLTTGWAGAAETLSSWSVAIGAHALAAQVAQAAPVLLAALLALGAVIVGLLAGLQPHPAATDDKDRADPFGEFFRREGAWLVLLFVLLHKIGDTLANLTLRLLFNDLGFTNDEIAFYDVGIGFAALLAGIFVGGLLYASIGMKRSVMISLILMAVSNLSFAGLAVVGHSNLGMAAAMSFENFASGIGGVAVVAYLSALCNLRFTATQYALLSAAASILGRLFAGTSSGATIEAIGYVNFYLFTTVIAFPGIILFWVMMRTGLADTSMGDAGKVGEGDARAEEQLA